MLQYEAWASPPPSRIMMNKSEEGAGLTGHRGQSPDAFVRTSVILRQSQIDRLRELAGHEDRSVSATLRKIIDRSRGFKMKEQTR
jgi:hypothetical protein